MCPPECLVLLNLFQDPLSHSVLLCEWYTLSFSSRTERIFRQFSTYDSAPALIYDAFIGVFSLYLPFGIRFLAWDHLYLIYCSPCSFPWVLFCRSLEYFKCDVDGAST